MPNGNKKENNKPQSPKNNMNEQVKRKQEELHKDFSLNPPRKKPGK